MKSNPYAERFRESHEHYCQYNWLNQMIKKGYHSPVNDLMLLLNL